VLVNAAGIEGDMVHGSPESTSLAEWRRVMAVNLDGTFLGCREALPVMKRKGAGSIINISSTVAYIATPNSTAYGASKAGVMQLTKSVALHGSLDGHRVRCNSVHPGIIATRMIESISAQLAQFNNVAVEAVNQASLARIPFGEAGRPEDVAELILFLASDESRYITGSEFSIDGGWRLMGRPKPANK
jgi:3(or 17)beta-hydroxysteroid dehydrogenase